MKNYSLYSFNATINLLFKMSNVLLKTVKAALPNCNQLPERVKEILNTVVRLIYLNL